MLPASIIAIGLMLGYCVEPLPTISAASDSIQLSILQQIEYPIDKTILPARLLRFAVPTERYVRRSADYRRPVILGQDLICSNVQLAGRRGRSTRFVIRLLRELPVNPSIKSYKTVDLPKHTKKFNEFHCAARPRFAIDWSE
jgi:hypothetical protein